MNINLIWYFVVGSDLVENLWDVLCIETWKTIIEQQVMAKEDLWKLTGLKLLATYQGMPAAKYWLDVLFDHLPSKTWPSEFISFRFCEIVMDW